MKNIRIFLSEFFFHFLVVKFSVYLNRPVFVMLMQGLYQERMHLFRLWKKHVQSLKKKIGIKLDKEL